MNKFGKTMLIIAVVMVIFGGVLWTVAWTFNARPQQLWFNSRLSQYTDEGSFFYQDEFYKLDWNISQSDFSFQEDGVYAIDAEGIQNLHLLWLTGEVEIQLSDSPEITLAETAQTRLTEETALRYSVKNGDLYVQYCTEHAPNNLPSKDITITLPLTLAENMGLLSLYSVSADVTLENITAQDFSFSSTSGDLEATNLTANTVEMDATSGNLTFSGVYQTLTADTSSGKIHVTSLGQPSYTELDSTSGKIEITGDCGDLSAGTTSGNINGEDITVNGADLDTTSGDIILNGSLDMVEANTVSGKIDLTLLSCPSTLEADTTSGNVLLFLPENSGFTLAFDTTSGSLRTDYGTVTLDNKLQVGDGTGEFEVDTVSGDLILQLD